MSSATTAAATIHDSRVDLSGPDPYGAVKGGVLSLSGKVQAAFYQRSAQHTYTTKTTHGLFRPSILHQSECQWVLVDPISRLNVAVLWWDISEERKDITTVYCLRMLGFTFCHSHSTILEPLQGSAGQLRSEAVSKA